MPSPSRFVIRPLAEPDESLRGYLLRLAQANGHPGAGWIIGELWGTEKAGALGASQIAMLERLAGLAAADVAALGSVWVGKARARLTAGVEIGRWWIDLRRPKICPMCLKERAVLRPVWDHSYVVACPRHGCEMLAACPRCARPLDWRRRWVDRCCGDAPLQDTRPRAADDGVVDIVRLIARAAGVAAPPPSAASLALVGHLDMAGLGLLVPHLAAAAGMPGVTSRSPMPPDKAKEVVARAGAVLGDWPGAFHRAIERDRVPEAASTTTSIAAEFPTVHRVVSRFRAGPEFAFLRDEFHAHLYSRHPGFRLQPPRDVEARAFIPMTDAERETGVFKKDIIAYARRGAFRIAVRPMGERQVRKRWLVDIAGLRRFAKTNRKGVWKAAAAPEGPKIPLGLAASLLGVDRVVAAHFLSSGLLGEPVVGVQAHPRVRRRAIEDLLSRLGSLGTDASPPALSPSGRQAGRGASLVRLTDHAGKRTGTLASLVREILRGGVTAVAIDEDAVGVRRFLFRREEVRRVADLARGAEGWATKTFVCTLLRGNPKDISRLVAAGFLRTLHASGPDANSTSRVSCASLAVFVAEFNTLGAVSHALGEHQSKVAARLRQADVDPVAVPGFRVPVFFRLTDLRRAGIAPQAALKAGRIAGEPGHTVREDLAPQSMDAPGAALLR